MLRLFKKFRSNYYGEDIISERKLEGGIWSSVTEYVRNRVINNQRSNRAVVFGNGLTRDDFDTNHLLTHKSGLLGETTLQSYACNAFFRDYSPDFLVITDRRIAQEAVEKNIIKDNIVYTRVDISLEFPKKFYLIPYDPYADAGTTALYIAAFDGHKKIYMVGFDGQDTPNTNNNIYAGTRGYDPMDVHISDEKWINNKAILFNTYDDVEFILVSMAGRNSIPEAWKYCTNFRQISYRDWQIEADL